MELDFVEGGCRYRFRSDSYHSLAIPLDFAGSQPSFFSAQRAQARVQVEGSFCGDVTRGGSCNSRVLEFIPHCQGTHTESVGHILPQYDLRSCLGPTLMSAYLHTVDLHNRTGVIEQADLLRVPPCCALVVRTLPNPEAKRFYRYGQGGGEGEGEAEAEFLPAYFSLAAMEYLQDLGVEHLLTDLPSIDAMDDRDLQGHRCFWGVHGKEPPLYAQKTITELIYVPNALADGFYLLDLQVPEFCNDAAPSRPLLYPLEVV